MRSITLTAPAKVNLFLKIQSRRPDGYHNIETLFERISLADEITISRIPSGIVIESDKFITAKAKDNLMYKAAESILRHRGVAEGVKISIKKRIPIAAGLGGGSSDAASVLMGINELFGLKLKRAKLMELGARLGADVPFFILGAPFAIGTGKGDKLKVVKSGRRLWHLVVYPGFKLATKDIYEAFDLLTSKSRNVKINPCFTGSATLERMLYNDLQHIATAKKKVLGRIIERLAYELDVRPIVSGSGPSVFCLCRNRKEALSAKKRLFRKIPAVQRRAWQVFIAGTDN